MSYKYIKFISAGYICISFIRINTLKINTSIIIDSLTIPEDSFLSSKTYQEFLRFKQIKNYIIFITKKTHQVVLPTPIENAFINSNPESYYMYQLLGDYYSSQNAYAKAISFYKQALTKECATIKEEKAIKESMNKLINQH